MSSRPVAMPLNNFDIDIFLRDYWQKKPLLIKAAWAAWTNPLEPDELAGLACEEGIESRIIARRSEGWAVDHGVFAESRFARDDPAPWTLLVQAVDHHVPDVAALIEPFRFIPNWRIDDVMVSYATDGGGVGPHFDQYDVFLIQGLGQRRWQVGGMCDADTPLLPHEDVRLLAEFEAAEEWLLDPGDILYVPPRMAHNGVAVGGDCMTYSVGFRAPARSELITDWSDDIVDALPDDDRYEDRDLDPTAHPGEISPAALARLHAMITDVMGDADAFARWFGAYNSRRKYPDTEWQPDESVSVAEVEALIGEGVPLSRNPASRFSFIRRAGGVSLFVDGTRFECGADGVAFVEQLCAQDQFAVDPGVSQDILALIGTLVDQGSVAFDEEE